MGYKILFTLSISLMLLGCNSQSEVSNTQNQNNATNTSEVPISSPDLAKPSFKINEVEITSKPQKFATGAFLGDTDETKKIAPPKGKVFVIVSFSVDVPTENLCPSSQCLASYDRKKDFILSDSVTSAMYWGKESWMEGNTFVYEKGTSVRKMLYIITSDRVRGAKIHFLGSDYPIEPFLSETPK